MEPWQWILSLVAIAVAAALIPMILQARRTLRAIEELTVATRPKLVKTLDEVSSATARLNQAAANFDRQVESIRPLMEGISDIARSVQKVNFLTGTLSAISSAIMPALTAAVASFFGRDEEPVTGNEPETAAAVEPTPLRRPARTGGEP